MRIDEYLDFFGGASESSILNWMMSKQLVQERLLCANCQVPMQIKKTRDNVNGFNWRCMNYECNSYQTTRALFLSGIFKQMKLPLRKTLKALVYLLNMETLADVSKYVNVNKTTVTKLKTLVVETIQQHFATNPIRLGGPGVVVHVDETMLTHTVRSHRGRAPRVQVWAITIVDTSFTPSRGYAKIVPSRDAQTLLPIIFNVVREGSIIHTDEWASYRQLTNSIQYEHRTVSHKYHFVDPETGVHIQNAESFNNKLKLAIKKARGVREDRRQGFLDLFLFVELFKNSSFDEFLRSLRLS